TLDGGGLPACSERSVRRATATPDFRCGQQKGRIPSGLPCPRWREKPMSRRNAWLIVVVILALFGLLAPAARADKKQIKPTREWPGCVADQDVRQKAPECITTAKELKKLWEAWKIAGKLPAVDFTREIVVVVTSTGSRLKLAGARLDEKGNLEVLGLGTRDERPGFRFVLATVSREGVKTVNGKALPKD